MKKVSLTIFVLLFFNFFLFSKSEFRSIEATSSSKNPGIVKVKTNYKSVDDQGHEKSSSQTKNFSTKDGSSYTIKLSDDGSDILFEESTGRRGVNPFASDDDFFDDFFDFGRRSRFDEMFEEVFGGDRKVRNNYSTRPEKAKISPPEIKKNKKVARPDSAKQYTPQQLEVLKYIEQLKKDYDL